MTTGVQARRQAILAAAGQAMGAARHRRTRRRWVGAVALALGTVAAILRFTATTPPPPPAVSHLDFAIVVAPPQRALDFQVASTSESTRIELQLIDSEELAEELREASAMRGVCAGIVLKGDSVQVVDCSTGAPIALSVSILTR